MEESPFSVVAKNTELVRTSLSTKKWYLGLLVLTIIVAAAALYLKLYNEMILAIPVIVMLLAIIRYDKDFIHVPPVLIFFAVVVMYLSLGSYIIRGENNILRALSETHAVTRGNMMCSESPFFIPMSFRAEATMSIFETRSLVE